MIITRNTKRVRDILRNYLNSLSNEEIREFMLDYSWRERAFNDATLESVILGLTGEKLTEIFKKFNLTI